MVPVETITPQPVPQIRLLRFTGKISFEGRNNGLPDEIYRFEAYDASSPPSAVIQIIEKNLAIMRNVGGMIVQKDQGSMVDPRTTIADNILVPWHWIVEVSTDVVVLSNDMPLPDDDGVERLPSGKPAPKN
jgi:hypothetical protein